MLHREMVGVKVVAIVLVTCACTDDAALQSSMTDAGADGAGHSPDAFNGASGSGGIGGSAHGNGGNAGAGAGANVASGGAQTATGGASSGGISGSGGANAG